MKESAATSGSKKARCASSATGPRSEDAVDIFFQHGSSFLSLDDSCQRLAPVCRDYRATTQKRLEDYCQVRHPALHEAVGRLTYRQYKRFAMKRVESMDTGTLWDAFCEYDLGTKKKNDQNPKWFHAEQNYLIDKTGDVEVLVEVSRAGKVAWFGVKPLIGIWPPHDYRCTGCRSDLRIQHYSFDAPRPLGIDSFAVVEHNGNDPGYPVFPYSPESPMCSAHPEIPNDESTDEYKAVTKLFHGERNNTITIMGEQHSMLKPPFVPCFEIHVVLRRRSTGQMVTVISERHPYTIKQMGKMYRVTFQPNALGDFAVRPVLSFNVVGETLRGKECREEKFTFRSYSHPNNNIKEGEEVARVEFSFYSNDFDRTPDWDQIKEAIRSDYRWD